jgi:hypothetical protein
MRQMHLPEYSAKTAIELLKMAPLEKLVEFWTLFVGRE